MENKRAFITGGAGFVGSHVNRFLAKNGWDTLVFDNLSTGKKEAVLNGQFIQGDLENSAALTQAFSDFRPHAVLHFAAKIDVGESVQNPLDYYRNNVTGTLNLLEAVRNHRVPYFIFSSTAAVYGAPQTELISETHPTQPINPYGKTKLIVEGMLADAQKAFGLSYISLRYFNAAGGDPEGILKTRKEKEINLIPIVLKNLLAGRPEITIFGEDYKTPDGTCVRDYIHVDDLANAHYLALKYLMEKDPSSKSDEPSCYNLGNGQGFSVKEVAAAIERVTKRPLKIMIGPRRPGDPARLVADASKAKRDFGWEPRYKDLDTICLHAYQNQVDG